ncbi:hypothetical protein [Salinispora vitiensis]|uniref:hypothetical protein n=1 Tax=Salinispora vitiensis TaxID=999544 RepID=UPI0004BBAF2E|nr:hypothetical protein [Salinispora vitiensis]
MIEEGEGRPAAQIPGLSGVVEIPEEHQAKLQQERSYESEAADPKAAAPVPLSPPSPGADPVPTPTPSKNPTTPAPSSTDTSPGAGCPAPTDGPPRRPRGGVTGGGGAGTAPTGGAGSRPGGGRGLPGEPTVPPFAPGSSAPTDRPAGPTHLNSEETPRTGDPDHRGESDQE